MWAPRGESMYYLALYNPPSCVCRVCVSVPADWFIFDAPNSLWDSNWSVEFRISRKKKEKNFFFFFCVARKFPSPTRRTFSVIHQSDKFLILV